MDKTIRPDEVSEKDMADEARTKLSDDEAGQGSEKPSFIKKSYEKIISLGYGNSIARLFTAWIITALVFTVKLEPLFNTFDFFNAIKMPFYLISIGLIFVLLSILNRPNADKLILFFSTLAYGSYAIMQDTSFYFAVGSCILMGGVAVYCIGDWIRFRFNKWQTMAIVAVLGVLFALFVGVLTSMNYRRHLTPCYDFGIFSQMFHYMKETLQPLTTCERDRLLSHFAVHFSPIYYLMLPVFFIFPTPETLLMCQGIIIASGLIPLYLICKKYNLSNNAIVLFSLCYVLLPSMANGCFYYLHENKFLAPLILWLAYALEKNSWVLTIIMSFLVLIVKEDAPVYVAVIGLYFLISRRNISKGAVSMIIAVVYFLAVSYFMSKYGLGTMNYRYDNFIYDGSGSLFTVIKAVILNPIYTIRECFDEDKIKFFLQMLVPLAFMPFMIKKPSRSVLLMPFILINLMSDYVYQHDIGFQYTYASASFLIYLSIMNYADIKPEFRKKLITVSASASVFLFMSCTYGRTNIIKSYQNDKESMKIIDQALEYVPDDASVAATTFLVPNLYDHKEVYEYESTAHRDYVEYIVLDGRWSSDSYSIDDYLNNSAYETVVYEPNNIAIFRNKAYNN
ncbi:MAG: DUF2079 domain-containing protein [Porcipelethomonas sp.]